MGAIMIDNWSIGSATTFMELNDEVEEELYIDSWINLINAVVLWDEIWYLDNSTSLYWKSQFKASEVFEKLNHIMFPIDQSQIDGNSLELLTNISASSILTYPNSPSIIEQRTTLYRLLSNALGINLLLHNKRNEFSKGSSFSAFDRLDIFSYIDRDLLEYYQYINAKLGREYLSFSYPILYDYIRHQTLPYKCTDNLKLDELAAAFDIRQEKEVIQFRDEIGHVESLINNGDTQSLLTQLHLLDEIAKDISNKYNKTMILAEFKLSLAPSLSRTFPVKIKCNKNMKIHTSFIKKIFSFGINERYRRDTW